MFYHGRMDGQIIATEEPKSTTPALWAEAEFVVLNAETEEDAATLLRGWLTKLARQQVTQLIAQLMGDR
jgi:hypothetical protein